MRIELERWFHSLSPDGTARVERLKDGPLPATDFVGRLGFFTDANACIARDAWKRVPFREVSYAEDRVLAIDMLRAGYAKAFVPGAAVLHSHDYSASEQFRRSFDEWRGLREVYGWRERASPVRFMQGLRGELGATWLECLAAGVSSMERRAALAAVTRHYLLRSTGALLGSRAGALPPWARRRLSLERRAGFAPLDLDETI